jgi:hypothetical protein
LSTTSLSNIDPACAATSTNSYNGGFYSVFVGTGQWPGSQPDVSLVKQFSSKYVALVQHQMSCSGNTSALNAIDADQTALLSAIKTVQLIN